MSRYLYLSWLVLASLIALPGPDQATDTPPVTVTEDAKQVVIDNGAVVVVLSKAKAAIVSIQTRQDGQTVELSKTMYYSQSAEPVGVAETAASTPSTTSPPSSQTTMCTA